MVPYTDFFIACVNGDLNFVIENLSGQNIEDIHDAFNIACINGHIDIVKELIKIPGLDVNKKNKNGRCVLDEACWYNNIDIVKILLKYSGININNTDNIGSSVLMNTCCSGNIEILNMLLVQKDINIFIVNKAGETVLSFVYNRVFMNKEELFITKKIIEHFIKTLKELTIFPYDIIRHIVENFL